MSRRNNALLEILAEAAASMPIWLSVFLAIVLYMTFGLFYLAESPEDVSVFALKSTFFVQLMTLMKMILPLALMIGAAARLFRLINERASNNRRSARPSQSAENLSPTCPSCDAPMKSRKAQRGNKKGQVFWGCSNYPKCRGTRPIN